MRGRRRRPGGVGDGVVAGARVTVHRAGGAAEKSNSNPAKYYVMRRHLLVKDCQRRRVFSQRDECRSTLRDSRQLCRRGKRRRRGGIEEDLVFRQCHFRRKRPRRRLEHQFHFPNRVNALFVQTAELCSRQIVSVLPMLSVTNEK